MTTVITVGGLKVDNGHKDKIGSAGQSHAVLADERVTVDYPQSLAADSIPTGVTNLNTAIRNTPGPKDVVGWSQGAEVVGEWLAKYAGLPDAPPAEELRFILLGNPRRRLGWNPGRRFNGKLLKPTPDGTQYTVIDIARRWDGWPNWDNWPGKRTPLAALWLLAGALTVHRNYDGVSFDPHDPDNKIREIVGNTTYVVAP